MNLPPNVEPSAFFRGTYLAYDPKGQIWHVKRSADAWLAQPAPNNPARSLGVRITANTLKAAATAIANRVARPPVYAEPF